ncbi:MAG TPA: hypothetical protein VFH24_03830 [Gemmatimonadales bacterium]|nr:hypothetical protein [Gemmatimonadales bacterium]
MKAPSHKAVQCCMALVAFAVAAGSASAQSPAAPSPIISGSTPSLRVAPENVRLNNYLHDLAGPGAFLGVVGGGLLDQLWRKPSFWSDNAEGLARRIGSRATQTAVQVSVRHGLASVMGYSTDYQPCECRGFGPKVEHALLETFTDRRADGSRALSVPRIAGAYAGGLTRLAWEPSRSGGEVALNTTLSFGFTAVFNIARELTGLAR